MCIASAWFVITPNTTTRNVATVAWRFTLPYARAHRFPHPSLHSNTIVIERVYPRDSQKAVDMRPFCHMLWVAREIAGLVEENDE